MATVTAEVRLWDRSVGALAEVDGRISFEFDPGFISNGWPISPLVLPTGPGVYAFPELRRAEAFEGLPGVFADALPDRFGNAIIQRHFTNLGRPGDAFSPVQKLLYVGRRAMGALEFEPAQPGEGDAAEPLQVARLVREARALIEGRADVKLPEIMRVGGSAGGARAKALIGWAAATEEVVSGVDELPPGFEPWLIKFDGAGDLDKPGGSSNGPFGRIECAYGHMAVEAGLVMPPFRMLEENGRAHFMVHRFDRSEDGDKVHMHSLCGAAHLDFNMSGAHSYEQLFRTCLAIGAGAPAIEQAYRRMIFNVVARNQDDHTKNFAFLMDRQGQWELSPAFDVTYANGEGWTREHQMTIRGKTDGFTRADLLSIGDTFKVRRAEEILDQTIETVSRWPEFAESVRVPADWMAKIAGDHRLAL